MRIAIINHIAKLDPIVISEIIKISGATEFTIAIGWELAIGWEPLHYTFQHIMPMPDLFFFEDCVIKWLLHV